MDEPARARTVLVVDDEPEIRATLGLMLEFFGYDVREAPGGEEALQLLGTAPVDAVILDRTMPGLDGDETLARLRRTHPTLPVVLCSGLERSADLAHGEGPTRFLLKPYTLDELADVLQALLP